MLGYRFLLFFGGKVEDKEKEKDTKDTPYDSFDVELYVWTFLLKTQLQASWISPMNRIYSCIHPYLGDRKDVSRRKAKTNQKVE